MCLNHRRGFIFGGFSMLKKLVSGIGTVSLVGSPLACASTLNVTQSQSVEEKLASLVGGCD